MSSVKWSTFSPVSTLDDTDEVMALTDPSGTPGNDTITIANLRTLLQTPFTWAASDEDAPLSTGILYITEGVITDRSFTKVIISVKNAPTSPDVGNGIEVDILEEGSANSFTTSIFSTKPKITQNNFTSEDAGSVSGVFNPTTFDWSSPKRLQLQLTINDNNFAATGLKVTLQ